MVILAVHYCRLHNQSHVSLQVEHVICWFCGQVTTMMMTLYRHRQQIQVTVLC